MKTALNTLEHITKHLKEKLYVLENTRPDNLARVLHGISPTPITVPHDRIEEAKKNWQDYLQGKNTSLSMTTLRYLCWDYETVKEPLFFKYIISKKPSLGIRGMKGFVSTFLMNYKEVINKPELISRYKDIFAIESVQSLYLNKVKGVILNRETPSLLAKYIVDNNSNPFLEEKKQFGVVLAGSSFTQTLLNVIAENYGSYLLSENSKNRSWFAKDIIPILNSQQLVSAISCAIASLPNNKDSLVRAEFKKLILNHANLGDPRIPEKNGNWAQFSQKTIKDVTIWFSSDDIHLFFESVFDKTKDTQGRKAFWEKYGSLVVRTRVILCDADRKRLTPLLAKNGYENNPIIGKLVGSDDRGSVFFMDFGTVLVVEYSKPNNLGRFYIHGQTQLSNNDKKFWSDVFKHDDFKECSFSLAHNPPIKWQFKFARKLQEHGVKNMMGAHVYY